MKYMMFVVVDPALQAEPSPDDLTIDQWLAEVDGRGQRITGDALRPPREAIAIAARHPQANGGKLELRPFWTEEDWSARQ